jgi:hypothetical protein
LFPKNEAAVDLRKSAEENSAKPNEPCSPSPASYSGFQQNLVAATTKEGTEKWLL